MKVSFSDVSVGYGSVSALSGVSLDLDPGFNVVLGPNGAGKTTLFRVGAGILPPDSGEVLLGGTNPHRDPAVKASVGYLPHSPALDPQLTVRENLAYWARVQSVDAGIRDQRIESAAESVGLEHLLSRTGNELSRGQKQRAVVARLLLNEPSVLFLDEPTNALDPDGASSLRRRLRELADDQMLVYSTHNLYEAEELADEVILVADGDVRAKGGIEELREVLQRERQREIALDVESGLDALRDLGYEPRRVDGRHVISIDDDAKVSDVVQTLVENGVDVAGVNEVQSSLEDIYHDIIEG